MGLLAFLIFGFVVGLLARALMPGRQTMGWGMTMVLGVVGSFVGGFLGSLLTGEPVRYLHPAGLIGSVVGALLVLGLVMRRHRSLL